jgi:hypothetical protein
MWTHPSSSGRTANQLGGMRCPVQNACIKKRKRADMQAGARAQSWHPRRWCCGLRVANGALEERLVRRYGPGYLQSSTRSAPGELLAAVPGQVANTFSRMEWAIHGPSAYAQLPFVPLSRRHVQFGSSELCSVSTSIASPTANASLDTGRISSLRLALEAWPAP